MTPSSASWARWRDTVLRGVPVAAARMRTDGKHLPVRSANATRFCNVQCRWRRTVRYRSRVTGTKGSKVSLLGCSAPARKRLTLGALCRCTPKGLAKFGEVEEALACADECFPASSRYGRPAFRGGFLLYGFWVLGLAEREPCAQRIPRA